MVRSIQLFSLAAALCLFANSASAAFTFQFSQPNYDGLIGGTGTVKIDFVAGAPGELLLGGTLNLSSSNAKFTFSSPTINITPASGAGQISTTINVASNAVNFETSNLTGTFTGVSSTGGQVLASGSFTNTATATAVPEPSSLALLGLGAVGYVVRRRRR